MIIFDKVRRVFVIATNCDVQAPSPQGRATPAGNAMLDHKAIEQTLISAVRQQGLTLDGKDLLDLRTSAEAVAISPGRQ
ncbi:hypothetical protein CJJ13_04820 [Serratia fonticola]|nr:hypothetical protein CJJ13_04820 [Serratia fonticola]